MKRRNFAHRPGCAVEATLDLIDGKWKGVILYHLQDGTQRFGELRRLMPGITQRMLTKQLRALEDDRLVIRTVYAEVPPRVEYRLSETGESLRPVIDILKAWGESHRERLSCAPDPGHRAIARSRGLIARALLLSPPRRDYIWAENFGISCMMLIRSFAVLLVSAAVCIAGAGAGSPRAVFADGTAAVLCADRAAHAAGGGQRLCRQDRAEPQPAAG